MGGGDHKDTSQRECAKHEESQSSQNSCSNQKLEPRYKVGDTVHFIPNEFFLMFLEEWNPTQVMFEGQVTDVSQNHNGEWIYNVNTNDDSRQKINNLRQDHLFSMEQREWIERCRRFQRQKNVGHCISALFLLLLAFAMGMFYSDSKKDCVFLCNLSGLHTKTPQVKCPQVDCPSLPSLMDQFDTSARDLAQIHFFKQVETIVARRLELNNDGLSQYYQDKSADVLTPAEKDVLIHTLKAGKLQLEDIEWAVESKAKKMRRDKPWKITSNTKRKMQIFHAITNLLPSSCKGWKQTSDCDPVFGLREYDNDLPCDAHISSSASGYCDCGYRPGFKDIVLKRCGEQETTCHALCNTKTP